MWAWVSRIAAGRFPARSRSDRTSSGSKPGSTTTASSLSVGGEQPAVGAERVPVEDVEVHPRHRTGRPHASARTLSAMERHVVLYDEDCGFCRWSLDRLLRWDRRGPPPRGADPERGGRRLLGELSEQDRLSSWHLVTPDGRRYSGGAATGPLARLMPVGAPVALLAETFPRITDRLYRWVARNRDTLGRRLGERTCAVDPSQRTGGARSG